MKLPFFGRIEQSGMGIMDFQVSEKGFTKKRVKNWFAIETAPKAEFIVLAYLQRQKDTLAYLPIHNMDVSFSPLLKGLIFVYQHSDNISVSQQCPGFKRYVTFGSHPLTIPDSQIILLKTIENHYDVLSVAPSQHVKGQNVIISKGPLQGQRGTLNPRYGNDCIAIEFVHLRMSILVKIPASHLLLIS